MRTLVPGEWYILFTCSECKTRQVLFPDLSQGHATLRATYKVACAKCAYRGVYESETLERYQHPPDADPLPFMSGGFLAVLGLLAWFSWLRIRIAFPFRLLLSKPNTSEIIPNQHQR